MGNGLIESARVTGILVLVIGVADSAFVHSSSSTLDGHTIIMAGIGLLVVHGGAAAKKASAKADTAADKASDLAAKTDDIDTKVSHLTNGHLRKAIQDAIAEGHMQAIVNGRILESIDKKLENIQTPTGTQPRGH